MDRGEWLDVRIQDASSVAHGVKLMSDSKSKFKRIHFRDDAAKQVGDLGNQAVRNHLARAVAQCQIPNVEIYFNYCNLNHDSIRLLANAVEQNTSMKMFLCTQNAVNYPNGKDYDASTDEPIKQAIIRSKAPLERWNWQLLPQDVKDARKKLLGGKPQVILLPPRAPAAVAPAAVPAVAPAAAPAAAPADPLGDVVLALMSLDLDEKDAKQCSAALAKQGFDTLKKLAKLHDSDVADCGITGFNKRVVLELKANLVAAAAAPVLHQPATPPPPPPAAAAISKLPPLPATSAFYAFLSHNWGENGAHNHARVRSIKDWFKQRGAPMWFDDERLTGDVATQIARGMDSSAAVVVFITKAYLEKVDKGADKDETDWCNYEFTYASTRMKRKIVVVVMEKAMLKQTAWHGKVGGFLGAHMYIDFTEEAKLEQCCLQLVSAIAGKI